MSPCLENNEDIYGRSSYLRMGVLVTVHNDSFAVS